MRLNTGQWLCLLDEFSQQVKYGNYKKTDYQAWRRISKWSGVNIWESGDEVVVENYNAEESSDSLYLDELLSNIEVFSIDDESLGAFLYDYKYDHFRYDDENMTSYKYTTPAGDTITWKTDYAYGYDLDTSSGIANKGTADSITSNGKVNITSTVSTAESTASIAGGPIKATIPADYSYIKANAVGSLNKVSDGISIRLDEFATKDEFKEIVDNIENLKEELSKKANLADVNKNEKENERMNMFKNFEFGKVNGDSVRMSMYGLAIRNQSGVWVSYNTATNEIVDVDVLNFNGEQFMYKMPVALGQVAKGDVIIHQRKPVFVNEVCEDGKMVVIDVFDGEEKMILPTKNMFGFNFATKVVSLMDMAGMGKPDASNPFGNMWMFALMGDGKDFDMKDMLMMSMMTGNNAQMNPMMMYALMGDGKGDNDMLMALALSGMLNQPGPAKLV